MTNETVHHPAHYGGEDNPYEVIKVAEAWGFDKDAYLFNALKYLGRAGKKGDTLEDLQKAVWYLERKLSKMETNEILADPETVAAIQESEEAIENGNLVPLDHVIEWSNGRREVIPEAEQCWPTDSTITVRYVPRSQVDPYPHATWTEYMTGNETCGEVVAHVLHVFGMDHFYAYRLKLFGHDPLTPDGLKLKDVCKPDDVLFLVEA